MVDYGQGGTCRGLDFSARRRFQSYFIKVLRTVSTLRNLSVPSSLSDSLAVKLRTTTCQYVFPPECSMCDADVMTLATRLRHAIFR